METPKKMFIAHWNADEIVEFLQNAEKQIGDLTPLMKTARVFLKQTVDENFETEGQHTGEKWKELSDKYKKMKLKKSKSKDIKILHFEGDLRHSIMAKSDQTSATVGTNSPYAAVHNFGFKGEVTKESKKGKRFTCNMNMPKREFMRINEIQKEYLLADLKVKLTELLMQQKAKNS